MDEITLTGESAGDRGANMVARPDNRHRSVTLRDHDTPSHE
jgi:hypothetical protein